MDFAEEIQMIIDGLDDIREDNTVPKNIRFKIEAIISILEEQDSDVSIKISRAQQELDDISEDSNIQPYTRTQIWNVSSLLETL